jgi:hypothetical protein
MVVRIELPSSFVAVIVAPPMGALPGSLTTPAIVPNVVWAFNAAAEKSKAADIRNVRFVIKFESTVESSVEVDT